MKKYSFIIIDDEGNNDTEKQIGYNRILMALEKHNYFMHQPTMEMDDTKINFRRNSNASDSIDFTVLTSLYNNDLFLSFCDAIGLFINELGNHDFFVFDLNLEKQVFNPCHPENNCEAAKRYKNNEPVHVTTDKVSRFISGLEFYNLTSKDNRPKIFLSAATQSAELRKNIKLFYKRLEDTFVVDAEHIRYTDINDPQILEAFGAIDKRFQSRQIAIINRQTADKIQALNNIVKAWNGSVDKADEPLIPDNGTDTNPENCWSLRTLFPKQVNRIELGIDAQENKALILETINNLNFPSLYTYLVHDHGNLDGKEYDKLKNEPTVVNRFPAIVNLELKTSGKVIYEKFSDIVPNQLAYNHVTIRKKIYDEVKFDVQNQTVYKESNGKLEEKEPLKIISGLTEVGRISQAMRKMAEYGLYLGDLKLICEIIDSNGKHNFSENYKRVNPILPKPNLKINYLMKEVIINISYDSDSEYYSDSTINIEPVYKAIKKVIEDKQDLKDIDQFGPTQIYKLLAYRYNTKLEVRVGNLYFSAGRLEITDIETLGDGNKTYFQFKLPTQINP